MKVSVLSYIYISFSHCPNRVLNARPELHMVQNGCLLELLVLHSVSRTCITHGDHQATAGTTVLFSTCLEVCCHDDRWR